jgi:hypothetical protein
MNELSVLNSVYVRFVTYLVPLMRGHSVLLMTTASELSS